MKKSKPTSPENAKTLDLERAHVAESTSPLTTNQGVPVANDQEVLKAGERGPALMEDFIFREKITHFDHERIPERIVHARGFGAHGVFRVYESLKDITKAHFLGDPALETPVFVRFSTVAGFRGSPDTVRDVRGFAVKFYTEEGNYDLVGNNMPVFFIQDAIKFPDLIHALKPEPHNEIPQAQSAHDTFWDFVAENPETAHNVMWLMSDRAIPRSYRMMEGFGIHTFKFVNAAGGHKFVKLHWKPLLGVHSLVWDETQKIAGKDPDFNRRDLWEAIEAGQFPEWELGIQVIEPEDEFKFDFDVLDCTKLWPEEVVPVRRVGKMTLNRNVANYFAETEQVAFCPANIVPGIAFTDDPMLQGRVFSYLDTQISRLGGPNFHQLPINRPVVPVRNNQRDGMHQMSVPEGKSAYYRNALGMGEPHPARGRDAFDNAARKVSGGVTRDRSKSFLDYYSQAALFWNSMGLPEKRHIVDAFRFELGKCKHKETRQKIVDMFAHVDPELAIRIAAGVGAVAPKKAARAGKKSCSPALSMAVQPTSAATKKVAIILEEGYDYASVSEVIVRLKAEGANYETVSCKLGYVTSADGKETEVNETYETAASVLYDGVYLAGGERSAETLKTRGAVRAFVNETYRHAKPVGAFGAACEVLALTDIPPEGADGVVLGTEAKSLGAFAKKFADALAAGRFWSREELTEVAG